VKDDHFVDDEFVQCEGCGDQVALHIARSDEEGLWLCPGCHEACVEDRPFTRPELIEGVCWAILLGLFVALMVAVIIHRLSEQPDPPRLQANVHLFLQVPDASLPYMGELDTPGEFAAQHKTRQANR
jgi:hypothetical protein